MKRREFIKIFGGVAVSLPLAARAQQHPMPVIGYVAGSMALSESLLTGFRKGLAAVGFTEGQNYRFEFRVNNFQSNLNPTIFRELADQKVALFLIVATSQIIQARPEIGSIPVVFHLGVDPVENGFVASLNRPGGNMTGVFNLHSSTTAKRLEALRELVPTATKFAFLTGPGELLGKSEASEAQKAAKSLGIDLVVVNARSSNEVDVAFETSVRAGAHGLIIGSDGTFYDPTPTVVQMTRHGLPTVSVWERFTRLGGLISYSTDEAANHQLMGSYAGRILKGEKPADMPVQQTTKLRLIVNLKTAKTMGITVPTSLLVRADEVIE